MTHTVACILGVDGDLPNAEVAPERVAGEEADHGRPWLF